MCVCVMLNIDFQMWWVSRIRDIVNICGFGCMISNIQTVVGSSVAINI